MLEHLTRRIADWRLRRITIRKLHSLDDHLLADLGIERENITGFIDRHTR